MGSPPLEAHLYTASQVLDPPITFLPWNSSRHSCYCCPEFGDGSPDFCYQGPLHSVKCTAWVAISKHGIIGPYWFEDAPRTAHHYTQWAVHWGLYKVIRCSCSTQGCRQGPPVVLAGCCHPAHLKWVACMASTTLPGQTHQPSVWPWVVPSFAGLETPRLLSVRVPEGHSLQWQPLRPSPNSRQ